MQQAQKYSHVRLCLNHVLNKYNKNRAYCVPDNQKPVFTKYFHHHHKVNIMSIIPIVQLRRQKSQEVK